MDFIGAFSRFITSVIPATEKTEPVRIVVEFLIYVAVLGLIAFARPIALRIPWIRGRLEPGEAYAGKYVQIIQSGDERRYSILEVFYDPKSKVYWLKGNQYDKDGNRAIDFTSQNVAFRDGPIDYIEFVWHAETILDKGRFDGYTMMRVDDKATPQMFEGRGFFVTFHHKPLRFDLRFFKISKERLAYLNAAGDKISLEEPRTEEGRHKFVIALHSGLQAYPHLEPKEEYGKGLL